MREQFAKGSHVDIDLPLPSGETMQVGGTVIYGKTQNGGGSVASQGMAIKFDRLTVASLQVLSELVANLLIGDIVTEQTEPVIRPI